MDNEDQIVVNSTATVMYSEGIQAAVMIGDEKKRTKLKVSEDKDNAQLDGKIIMWGNDNLFPQTVLKECRKNTIVGTTLDKMARIAYEGGIEYGKIEIVNGGRKYIEQKDERVEAFMRRSRIHRYLVSGLRQFYWFYNIFPEIVLSQDKSEIHSIHPHKTAYCRYEAQKNGVVKNCYISASWEEAPDLSGPLVNKVPVVDIFADASTLTDQSNSYNFIYPVSYPTENEDFYSLVDWNSLRTSGWLEVAQAIPQFKKALFKNQITIKYIIKVSSYWWNWKYPGFDEFDTKKKQKLMKKELETFEKFLKGGEKAGSSLMTTFFSNPQMQKEYDGWKVEAVDNKIKDGIHIEDSNEASSHLLYALGMDPTIIGSQPGSKLGSGSGSDKRVAFNIYTDAVKAHQDFVLEPLYYIDEFNGYGMDYYRFRNRKADADEPSKEATTEPNQQAA